MRILHHATTSLALVLACQFAQSQQGPIQLYITPGMLFVGSGATDLRVFGQALGQGLNARWNGAARPATIESGSLAYIVKLTAEDVARPGLSEISMVDGRGRVIASTSVPVGYNVMPGDVVVDRTRNRFYLTTPPQPGDSRFPGNSIVALDPDSGRIGPVLQAGNYPGKLALSEDGSTLYVTVDGDGVVRRLNPENLTVVSEFRFRPAGSLPGRYSGTAIAVMPSNSSTVAIYDHPNPGSSLTRIAVYDNGVKRSNEIASFDGFDSLLFSPDGRSLFLGSYATVNTPRTLMRYSVEASGLRTQTPQSALGGGPVVILDGILYTSLGTMVDVQTMEVRSVLGVGGSVAVDAPNRRILALHIQNADGQQYPEYLQAFDFTTKQPLGWQPVDTVNYFDAGSSSVRRLIRFGTDGLLFTSSRGLLLFHTPIAGPAPATEARAVINAAGQQGGGIAPGEILSIYGTNLGPEAPQTPILNAAGNLDPELSHVRVWFDHLPGTVLLAYKGQINVIAPFGLRPGSTVNLQVWYFGIPSARIPIAVQSAAPALFTRDGSGRGLVSIINQDGTINAPSAAGGIITIYGTGGGPTPGVIDGALAGSAQRLTGAVRVTIGNRDVPVLYAGAAPQLPNGVFQINAQVPGDIPSGIIPLRVTVDGQESPSGVTLEIR